MHISVKWFDDKFNFSLHANAQADEFLTVKGCRIVDGSKGRFVSGPSSKMQNGNYWNHIWLNQKFAQAVLEKAEEAKPREQKQAAPSGGDFDDSDIPF